MASSIRVLASALALAATVATAQPVACDRQCLEGLIDRYLDALVRHDPAGWSSWEDGMSDRARDVTH